MPDKAVVEVYSAQTAADAHVVKNALEGAGIEARVVGDALQSGMGYPPWEVVTPRVWVRARDELRARESIARWQEQRLGGKESAPWHCSACGEEVSGEFEVCWQCGANRDGTPDPQFHREQTEVEAAPDASMWSPFQYSLMALVVLITLFAALFALLKFTATGDPAAP